MKKKMSFIFGTLALTLGLSACGVTKNNTDETKEETKTANTETAETTETSWPDGPVTAVLHAAAGGDTDFNARTFATYFEEITGQPMIITNMPGSSGVAATENVKQAKADGNTFLFTHTGPLVVNKVSGLIDYDYSDFDVSNIPAVDGGTILVASKQSGLTSFDDVIKKAKEAPGEIVFGTEFGNYSHLQVLMLQDKADIEFKLADIGSTADKVTNLVGGRIDLAAITYGSVKDYIETGDMIPIAQFNDEANPFLGDIPTLKSKGIDMVMDKPYIVAFPKGTDPAIIKKMSDIAVEISKNEDYAKKIEEGFSQESKAMPTEEALKYLDGIREDYMKYTDILQGANK